MSEQVPGSFCSRQIAASLLTVLALVLGGCQPRIEDTAEYRAVCHGPPLHGAEQYEEAQVAGYDINRQYECITEQSYRAVQEQKAQWEAANTPEAKARRQADMDRQHALFMAEQQRKAAQAETEAAEAESTPPPEVVLRAVDVNTASESDIAAVISVGPQTAARIVAERDKRRFADWADLVRRVVDLSAAQPAAFASVCGLTVNGKSLDGAPPNATFATALRRRLQH